MSTYRIEVASEDNANPNSNRAGLWTTAAGEATGWTFEEAKRAAHHLVDSEDEPTARVVDESTGEVVYAI